MNGYRVCLATISYERGLEDIELSGAPIDTAAFIQYLKKL